MKKTVFLLSLACSVLAAGCGSPDRPEKKDSSRPKSDSIAQAPGFDSVLAAKYGADEYGMHGYVMAFLRKGPNREQDSVKRMELQKAHMANIDRMAEEGKLVVAGPFTDDGEIRGIYIFNVATVEEARSLTETDPLIKSGGLVMELHPWYGSAGLMGIPETHKRLSRKSIF